MICDNSLAYYNINNDILMNQTENTPQIISSTNQTKKRKDGEKSEPVHFIAKCEQ
jgi:hypothetical protein